MFLSAGGLQQKHRTLGLNSYSARPPKVFRAVELLAMTVFYHRGGKLGLGHTLPLGEPWMEGSMCDHFLVSLPYPFGPDLEIVHVGDRHVEFLWLLPITEAERDLKVADGLETLESRFEEVGLHYWEIDRTSVV